LLLEETDIQERIESPLNLLNRLNRATRHTSVIGMPTASDVIEDLDKKLDFISAKSKALGIMNKSMELLESRLEEVNKPRELAAIAAEMGKVLANTEIKKDDSVKGAHVIIYAPSVVNENIFPILDNQTQEEEEE
jgi:hypothetical protein